MSPPLSDPDAGPEIPVKRKKTMSAEALAANRSNARLSRGPGRQAKERTKFNARKHDLRAESDLVPGESREELERRLSIWPELLQAGTELEEFTAQRFVRMGWRIERAERSEDAATEKRQRDLAQSEADKDAEQAHLLGLELDGDGDPGGVISKLNRTPAGCTLLWNEWRNLYLSIFHYDAQPWSRRERLFRLLGRTLQDVFCADPARDSWLTALLGSVCGDDGDAKVRKLGEALDGLRPAYMQDQEYDRRIAVLASELPDVAKAIAILRAGFDMVRTELAFKHNEALADWQYDLTLACDAAEVDDSADGARRLGYKLGHSRSFDAAHRRLQALQKDRRSDEAAMAADSDGTPSPDPGGNDAANPVAETPVESVATDEPVVTATEDAVAPVTEADTLGVEETQSGLITNDPIRFPTTAIQPLSAPGAIDPIGADPYVLEEVPAGADGGEPDGDAPPAEYWPAVPVSASRETDGPLNEEPRPPADSLARVVDPRHRELEEWPAGPEPEPDQELPDQDAALADPLRRYLEMFDGLQPPPDSS